MTWIHIGIAPQPSASAPSIACKSQKTLPPAPPKVSPPSASVTSREPKPARPGPVSRLPRKLAQTSADALPSVVHAQIPTVPRSALRTIHGRIRVAVLVMVDRSGNVTDAVLENPGPSWYFARLARQAAGQWKFAPADARDSRRWVVRFEFTRGGTTGHATPRS